MATDTQHIEMATEVNTLRLENLALKGKIVQLQEFFATERKRAERADEQLKEERKVHRENMSAYLELVRMYMEQSNLLEKLKTEQI
jgi:hypothetical protein